MQVEHISTLDRLIATKQVAELAGHDLIAQNLEIAISDLETLKESYKNNIMFLSRAPGKNELSNIIHKVMESEFTCKKSNQ